MIRIESLSKSFGAVQALANVTLTVERGEAVGLVGSNGSGRTTLLRILATLSAPSAGSVTIDGHDLVKHVYLLRPRIAFVADGWPPDEHGRVDAHLCFALGARGRAATPEIVAEAVARAGLDGRSPVGHLSGGMRQRLALCAALAAQPAVLLMDDPFRGLDAAGRSRFAEWFADLRTTGTAIVMAADEDDVAATCTGVARFEAGRLAGTSIVAADRPSGRLAAALSLSAAPLTSLGRG